jgi:hypothetical protein
MSMLEQYHVEYVVNRIASCHRNIATRRLIGEFAVNGNNTHDKGQERGAESVNFPVAESAEASQLLNPMTKRLTGCLRSK